MKTVYYLYLIDEHTYFKTLFKGEYETIEAAKGALKSMSGRYTIVEVIIA